MVSPPPVLTLMSSSVVIPDRKSTINDLKLSVSDLPMLSCHYIQKGCLFTRPANISIESLIPLLQLALSRTLTHFPPLAGRLITDDDGYVYIACNDAGAEFLHAKSAGISIGDVICPTHVPEFVRGFFAFQPMVSYQGHFKALLAVQVTELADGVFVGVTCNHAVIDGTSFWNFFNTFAEICRRINIGKNNNNDGAGEKISRKPDFSRNSVLISPAVLKLPAGGPTVTFDENAPLKERIFSFSREAIQELKAQANNRKSSFWLDNGECNAVSEIMGKQIHDRFQSYDGKKTEEMKIPESWLSQNGVVEVVTNKTEEISSFQALCALLWRAVTRARKLPTSKTTTFRMAVNCRHRLNPKLDPLYFGNAIQSIPTTATAGEVTWRDLRWCAEQLSFSLKDYDERKVRKVVSEWESNPRCFPLGNFDGAMITMGSSPRFPMFDNDFGWGRPMAVRSGGGNKFDGKISAFPGREGNGWVDLEVVLAPETMDGIESDSEFMRFVSC